MRALRKWLVYGLMALFVLGCGSSSGDKEDPPATDEEDPGGEDEPTDTVSPGTPTALTGLRLLRRVTLSLNHRLPTAAERTATIADPLYPQSLPDALLASRLGSHAVAQLHRWVWNLRSHRMTDLDRFASSNSTLAANLTAQTKQEIVSEPLHLLSDFLQRGLRFEEWFRQSYTIVHDDVLSLWELTSLANPWSDSAYNIAVYGDGRPSGGVLSTNGFFASYDSENRSSSRSRMAHLVEHMTCTTYESISHHSFASLSEDELQTDLASYAAVVHPCTSCHNLFHSSAHSISGMAVGQSFADWKQYSTPSTNPATYYAGHLYEGFAGWINLFASDPRVHSCEVQRVYEALLERPFNDAIDIPNLVTLIDAFNQDQDIKDVIQRITEIPEFRLAPLPSDVDGEVAAVASGVRYLTRSQWMQITRQLSPRASATLDFPDGLDPGHEIDVNRDRRLAVGSYYHHIDRLARQLATFIVADELASEAEAASRKVLTLIPDGSASAATDAQIEAQLIELWSRLTGETIVSEDTQTTQLTALWQAARAGGTSDDSHRTAWRTALVGIFLSPNFFMY